MRFFSRKQAENERNQDNSRTNEVQSRSDEIQSRTREHSLRLKQGELDCEEAIMKDRERFGRVRKSLMNYLRETYGEQIANRALWRVDKRRTEGYFASSK
ncbi:MAG: hypothetical protein ACRDFB_02405 [Rhabdochlamydiaceae bacterium]